MVFTFVFGLGAITMLMGVMKVMLRFESGLILFLALLSFLVMLSLEAVFIRLLFRRRRDADEPGDEILWKGQATGELDAAKARRLPEPMPSVTEHTTRAFDPIYSERKLK